MKAFDTRGNFKHIFGEGATNMDIGHVKEICKMHEGKSTCRYLGMGASGFVCMKGTELQSVIDSKVEQMKAQGDNCPGFGGNISDENRKEKNEEEA